MIVQDLSGTNYDISDGNMVDLDMERPWFIRLSQLRTIRKISAKMEDQLVYGEINRKTRWVRLRKEQHSPSTYGYVAAEDNKIGCREFSPETFAKILKAAGVKTRKPAKKAK